LNNQKDFILNNDKKVDNKDASNKDNLAFELNENE